MNNVYIRKQPEYNLSQITALAVEMLQWGGIDKRINGDTTILLKPNMLSKSTPDKAVTTHPVCGGGSYKCCEAAGCKK